MKIMNLGVPWHEKTLMDKVLYVRAAGRNGRFFIWFFTNFVKFVYYIKYNGE